MYDTTCPRFGEHFTSCMLLRRVKEVFEIAQIATRERIKTPGNAMLFSPTAMGITGFTALPSATHFSISPATCQGQAAVAVAAFAGFQRRRPQAPEIICASQFARLQKILNTAIGSVNSAMEEAIIDDLLNISAAGYQHRQHLHQGTQGKRRCRERGLSKPDGTVETPSQKSSAVWAKTQVNQCIGVSRGDRSTKIHAAVDALGNPIAIMLTTGNTPDITVAEKLIRQINFKDSTILADRAYGKWEFREFIANHDADFCIPPKKDNTDP